MRTIQAKGVRLQIADENGEYRDIADLYDKEIKLEFPEFEVTGTMTMDLSERIRLRVWVMMTNAVAVARRILG